MISPECQQATAPDGEERGWAMILDTAHGLGQGAFAAVFSNPERDRAFKLFFDQSIDPNVVSNAVRRRVFSAEVEAYTIASAHPELSRHVPRFYGTVSVSGVIDPVSRFGGRFLWDCCYGMQLMGGRGCKLGNLSSAEKEEYLPLLKMFRAAGIVHTADASMFPGNVLVDFATRDVINEAAEG